ncbi:hypothetical protein KP509_18G031200 [Ceratopteris richardii]|uniref:Pentatricopeptide repeat-containing protein n=1 Tax=Ceratopteris richardii TaxID=49495 RepID=A0A8T2SQM8_CERRI|nr:hypothetical protein KP509_18G031200 [Ceratopteris richardii]
MYSKHGTMEEACKVFSAMTEQTLVSSNVMIAGFVKHGLIDRAWKLFRQILSDYMSPDIVTITSMVQACIATRNLDSGRLLFLCNSLEFGFPFRVW